MKRSQPKMTRKFWDIRDELGERRCDAPLVPERQRQAEMALEAMQAEAKRRAKMTSRSMRRKFWDIRDELGRAVMFLLLLSLLSLPARAQGRVYVRSEPSGAMIFLVQQVDGTTEVKDLGTKTPRMVPLDVRKEAYMLVLRKEAYKDGVLKVLVSKAGIIKPDVQKLDRETRNVDVIYEHGDGWQVFVDGKPVRDIEGKVAVTPCTIPLVSGAKKIQLAKKGYLDLTMYPKEIRKLLNFTQKPWKGRSSLLRTKTNGKIQKRNPISMLKGWHVKVYKNGWQRRPLSAMKIQEEKGGVSVTNTTGIHNTSILSYDTPLSGDFTCTITCDISIATEFGILGNNCSYFGRLPIGKNMVVIFKRTGSTVTLTANGRNISTQGWNSAGPNLNGYLKINLQRGQAIMVRQFKINP